MSKDSRADWLIPSKYCLNSNRCGRKRFTIHKNDHRLIIYPDSPEKNTSQLLPVKVNSKTPDPYIQENKSQGKMKAELFYDKKLKEKDLEIKLLKELYDESYKKVKDFEKILVRTTRSNANIGMFGGMPSKNSGSPEMKWNRPAKLTVLPMFSQIRYTKNHPKVVLNNPITGIAPIF